MDKRPYLSGPGPSNMSPMQPTGSVLVLSERRQADLRRRRDAAVERAISARRELDGPSGGRAWINGRELGGKDARHAHLYETYD